MKKTTTTAALMAAGLLALAGCTGDNGETAGSISGKLMDGYVKGAVMCLDVNKSLACDTGEASTFSASGGDFKLYLPKATNTAGVYLVAEVGASAEDSDAPGQAVAPTRMLGLADKPGVVSPLTTVVVSFMQSGDSQSDAESHARTLLGLSADFDFWSDYIQSGNADAHAVAKSVNLVATNLAGGGKLDTAQFLEAVTAVQGSLRASSVALLAALTQWQASRDVLVGDFDAVTPTFGAIGGATLSVTASPDGGSGNALSIVRPSGSESFAGVGIDAGAMTGSQYYTVSARVHVDASMAGKPIHLKLESPDGSTQSSELPSRETPAAGWQTLTWVFDTSPGKTYGKLILLPDVGAAGGGEVYYVDNIELYPGWMLADFDELTPGFFGSNGSAVVTKASGPSGGNGNALKVVKQAGEPWAGAIVNLDAPITGATAYTLSARVYSPLAGAPMTLKLANFNDSSQSVQASANEVVVQGWQTLTWNLPGAVDWWYLQQIFFQPNDGQQGSGEAYYIDDVKVRLSEDVLANFGSVVPGWFGSSGSATVSTVTAPLGISGSALQVVKNAADTWAGAAMNLGTTLSGATTYRLTARVYSPKAGASMILKLVNLNDDTQSVQAASSEAVVAGWQTLSWELDGAQAAWSLNKLFFQPDDGHAGAGDTYYITDIAELAP